jgi:hypothetical protein
METIMEEELTSVFVAELSPSLSSINFIAPKASYDSANCECCVQLGIFFDGTGNNVHQDSIFGGDSNIARIFSLYDDAKDYGRYKIYIPGVGTPCPEIGDEAKSKYGMAFGSGCQSRIVFALVWVLNTLSKHMCLNAFFSSNQIKGICTATPSSSDRKELESLGIFMPLGAGEENEIQRNRFLLPYIEKLSSSLGKGTIIKECFIDVFGFSRGAAEARVFCSWFFALLEKNSSSSISFIFRFIGIFDTVASSGVSESIGNAIVNSTGGHVGWAKASYLGISDKVENCVHMIAMHELRKNFPLDEISVDGVRKKNFIEVAYPGTHSDVGGGYRPGDLGIASNGNPIEDDSKKLSQISLVHMLQYARAAGVPVSTRPARQPKVHADLKSAYEDFLQSSKNSPRMLSEWMLPYLAWRWQVRKQYLNLSHVKRASNDRKLLIAGNEELIGDANAIELRADENKATIFTKLARTVKKFDLKSAEYRQDEISSLDPEAALVLARAKAFPPLPAELADFFDNYVHDSLAGFRASLKEPTGYWRFRRSFRGSEVPELSMIDDAASSKIS